MRTFSFMKLKSQGVRFLSLRVFKICGELVMIRSTWIWPVNTWKSHSNTQISIWLKLKEEEFIFLKMNIVLKCQRLYLGSLFVDDQWYKFKVLSWTLFLRTYVMCHYTHEYKFTCGKIYIFILYEIGHIFLRP